jgi:hypothetical protein
MDMELDENQLEMVAGGGTVRDVVVGVLDLLII